MSPKPVRESAPEGNSTAVRVVSTVLGAALLVLGFGSWRSLSRLQGAAAESEARDARAIALLQTQNERLTAQSIRSATPRPAPEPTQPMTTVGLPRTEALDFLMDLARGGYFATPSPTMLLRRLGTSASPYMKVLPQPAYMINANASFGPGFAEFFGLSEGEALSLQSALAGWRGEMEAALHARTVVRRDDDGAVVLEVSPVDGASALSAKFTALLQQGLGPERFRLFKELNTNSRPPDDAMLPAQMTGNMNFFGEGTATYTVKRTPNGVSVNYSIKARNGSSGGSAGARQPATSEALREQLLAIYGPVMKLIPADF